MKRLISVAVSAVFLLGIFSGCSNSDSLYDESRVSIAEGEIVESLEISEYIESYVKKANKKTEDSNPISAVTYCADPTAVEYNGRLYVFGTNDQQQYEAVGDGGKNTYEKIKSLVVFSTDDMVNWTYHGEINVEEVAPWIVASWAPSIVSRVEDDGLTHFYLYFSNSGCGVGVITATDPLGPWSDPLGHSLVDYNTPGLGDCPSPFDPGVCIDDDGVGWLSFGAGIAQEGSEYMPDSARIVRLGSDMISLDSPIAKIPALYNFEASELNYINGTYVYTYNNSWRERTVWENDKYDAPPACSMSYMVGNPPLDPDSWEYRGDYFLNPGHAGMNYSNNHTHLHKYKGEWYIFYHTTILDTDRGGGGDFRSLCVDKIEVNEKKLEIEKIGGTRAGTEQIKKLNSFSAHSGAEMSSCARIEYADTPESEINPKSAVSTKDGAWIYIRNVDFSKGASQFYATVSGCGQLEVRLDSLDNEPVAAIRFDSDRSVTVCADVLSRVKGTHDVFILFSSGDITLEAWQFK